ncbi:MAG: ATP synthase F1 subunit epsilon [Leptospiraceae bacterium]|nr:ATP synthase F1 subunit epsilon [Leptospiraceae bacterium]
MAKKFEISVISPEKILYSGEATYVSLPGTNGLFGVMANHAPLVAELEIGILRIENEALEFKMVVDGGFVQVKGNKVNVLANGGALKEEVQLAQLEKLKQTIETKTTSEKERELKKIKFREKLLNE